VTIDEAIKLQDELLKLLPEVGFNKYIASTKLGSLALKQYKVMKDTGEIWDGSYLPGETKE